MKREDHPDANVIALLVLWWRIERTGALSKLDFPHECPSTRGWLASRQWDDQNGAFETDERGQVAKLVGAIVDRMEEPYRTALYILARNRATGRDVWHSPRIPSDRDERAWLVADAVAKFAERV